MKKYFAMLMIYDELVHGHPFKIKDIEDKFGTNRRTCFRYIHDIKEFVDECHPDKDIFYDRRDHSFRLSERNPREKSILPENDNLPE